MLSSFHIMNSNNKVVVVGAEGCGKTSLLDALSCGTMKDLCTTDGSICFDLGIDFEGETYSLSVLEISDIDKSTEVAIATSAAVLLLIDSISISRQTKALHLLQKVKDVRGNKKIAIISTKCDDGPVMRGHSSKLYPYVSTSIQTKIGIDELRRVVLDMVYPDALKQNNLGRRVSIFIQEKLRSKIGTEHSNAHRSRRPSETILKIRRRSSDLSKRSIKRL